MIGLGWALLIAGLLGCVVALLALVLVYRTALAQADLEYHALEYHTREEVDKVTRRLRDEMTR